MAIEYHINQRDELITLTATGSVTGSAACECLDAMLNDPAFNAALPQLIDLRAAEPCGTAEDLREFETFLLGCYHPRLNASVAIVVNPDWHEKTCAKAFWISCALGCAELFDSWSQACKWLINVEFGTNLVDLPEIESLFDTGLDDNEQAVDDQPSVTNPALAASESPITPRG